MKKTVLASALVAALLVPAAGAPALAADGTSGSRTVTVEQARAELAEVDAAIVELRAAEKATPGSDYSQEIRELLDVAFELRGLITQLATGQVPTVDFATISTRVAVVTRIASTIDYATTNLRHKVRPAHVELSFAITKAVTRVANPSSTQAQLEASLAELESDLERVKTYPDLTADDEATVYVRVALTQEIWQTRVKRDKFVLGKVPTPAYLELNRAITKAVGVELDPSATVREVDGQIEALRAAYDKARSAAK